MNNLPTLSVPRHRLHATALSIALSTVALAGCGPQSASPPAQPVAMAPAPAPTANPGTLQPQPQVLNAGNPTSGQYPAQYPPTQAQPSPPSQGQQMAQVPNGYPQAQAPRDYPRTAQPVPQAAPIYQDAPPANVAQGYPSPTYAPAPAPKAHRQPAASRAPVQVASNHIGRVESIEPIRERPQGSGAGGVLGGVLGAVVGNQFGHGNGRAALTVLGGVGGAVAGNNVERNVKERVVGYRISVVLDDGASRTYEESSTEGLRVGDRVRVEGNGLRRI